MRAGLFASLKGSLATLLAIGRTRLELLAIEVAEEKQRLLSLVLFALGALFFLGLGLVMLVIFFAALFWESKIVVFAMFTLLFLGGGALLGSLCLRQARRGSALFAGSIAELSEDLKQLKRRQP